MSDSSYSLQYTGQQIDTLLQKINDFNTTDNIKFVDVSNNENAVDNCTDQKTIYYVRFTSGIVTNRSYFHLICVNCNDKLVQYAFSRGGFILYRGIHPGVDENWEEWSYLPTIGKVQDLIDSLSSSIFAQLNNKANKATTLEGYNITDGIASYNCENDEILKYVNQEPYTISDYTVSNVNTALTERKDIPNYFATFFPANTTSVRIVNSQTKASWEESAYAGQYKIKNLIPNQLYVFYALDPNRNILASGSCVAKGQVRMLDIPQSNGDKNLFNIRDIGGWKCDNGRLKYGKIIRGCRLNGSKNNVTLTLDNSQVDYLQNVLKIQHEIDLRDPNSSSSPAINSNITNDYQNITLKYYQASITSDYKQYKKLIHKIATNLINGGATYIHCSEGADRTGIAMAILEGLCGVSLSDIERDYELTAYAFDIYDTTSSADGTQMSTRRRNFTSSSSSAGTWKRTLDAIDTWATTNNVTGSFQEKIIQYLLQEDTNDVNDISSDIILDDIKIIQSYLIEYDQLPINDYAIKSEVTDQIYTIVDDIFGNSSSVPDLYVAPKNSNYSLQYQDSNDAIREIFDFTNLPFAEKEVGNIISDNIAWYYENSDWKIEGTYTLIGNLCFLQASARLINGWQNIYYSLPVAAANFSQTILHWGGKEYIIQIPDEIDNNPNYSVLNIRRLDGNLCDSNDTIHFTLIYRRNSI